MFKLFSLSKIFGNSKKDKTIQALRESEAKYRALVEHSLISVYVIQDGLFRYVNQQYCNLVGYSYDEIVDKMGPSFFTYSEDNNIVEENIRKRISGEVTSIEYELRIVRRDGQILYVKVIGDSTIFYNRPAITGSLIDLTDKKQAEIILTEKNEAYIEINKALELAKVKAEESEERLRLIFENAPIGILHFNNKGEIITCNDKFVEIIGSSKQALIGLNMLTLPDTKLVTTLQ